METTGNSSTDTIAVADTGLWDAYIAQAPNFAVAQDRMEEALAFGVRLQDLLAIQMQRTGSLL